MELKVTQIEAIATDWPDDTESRTIRANDKRELTITNYRVYFTAFDKNTGLTSSGKIYITPDIFNFEKLEEYLLNLYNLNKK